MKRILFIANLLMLGHGCFASCIPTYGKVFVETMNIKNNTPDPLYISGSDCTTDPNEYIKSGESKPYSKSVCSATYTTAAAELQTTHCTGTTPSGQQVEFTVNYGSCNAADITPTTSSDTLSAFACPYSYHPETGHAETRCGSSGMQVNYQTTYFYVAAQHPSYTLEWNNISMSLTKGQIMANKLANLLLKNLQYNSATASYNGSKLRIVLSYLLDPYANCKDGTACSAVNA